MRKKVQDVIAHPLISGSIIIFVGSTVASFIHFLFNLYMTRTLTLSEYGVLATLVSIISLTTLPATAIVPLVIRFGADYFAKKDLNRVHGLFNAVFIPTAIISGIIGALCIIFSLQIANFFHIESSYLLFYVSIAIILAYLSTINTALLQARLSFNFIALTNLIGAITKVISGFIFVVFGFKLVGAVIAYVISYFIPYIVSFIPFRFIFQKNSKPAPVNSRHLFTYGMPSAITQLSLSSLITSDLLLVKHFFDPYQAGIYAMMSLIGRVIFFFISPIISVMFPLVVQKYTKRQDYTSTFYLAIALVIVPALSISAVYFLFPEFVIRFFSKSVDSLGAVPYLALFGIFITIYSLLSLVSNFLLSIQKTWIFLPLTFCSILQVVILWFYHENFQEVILVSLVLTALMLTVLLVYYFYITRLKKL